jgi:hypothetical protein
LVDLVLLQSLSYVAAAIGVCVAALNYLRISIEEEKKKKIQTANNIMNVLTSKEGVKSWIELLNMEWTDYDDFERKYGTDFNVESSVARYHVFFSYETIGNMVRSSLADAHTVFLANGWVCIFMWDKFRQVIEENRRRYSGKDAWTGFEYLAGEMAKIKSSGDPLWVVPPAYGKYVDGDNN